MLFFTEDMIEYNIDECTLLFNNEKSYLDIQIQYQENIKNLLNLYMEEIIISIDDINQVINGNKVFATLEDLTCSLNFCNNNIVLYKYLQTVLNGIKNVKDIKIPTLDKYNTQSIALQNIIDKNVEYIQNFICSVSKHSISTLLNTAEENVENNSKNILENILSSASEDILDNIEEKKDDNTFEKNTSDHNLVENTLIISDIDKKVILPYYISELESEYHKNPNKYSSIEDVIDKKYTFSLDRFNKIPISRFREAFNLMYHKEKQSLKSSLNLAFELLFNYNLHPAIIAACRNIDELDIYLDCLDNNETNLYKCFDIIFQIAPTIVSKKFKFSD